MNPFRFCLAFVAALTLSSFAFAAPKASIDNVAVTPGPNTAVAKFTVTLDAPAATPVIVHYATVEGTGSSGAGDYAGVTAATLTIPAGAKSGSIDITVKPHVSGPVKTFTVHLASATGATIAVANGTGTIQIPAPPPVQTKTATTAPAAAADISDQLNKATAPVNLPKGTYAVSKAVVLNTSIELNGSTILCPAGLTNFRFAKPNLVFDDFVMPAGGVAFEFGADHCTLSNGQIALGQSNTFTVEQACKTIAGGTNAIIKNVSVGLTGTCSIYIDEGAAKPTDPGPSLTKVNLAGVFGGKEYPLRLDVPASGIVQCNATIKNCIIVNHSTAKDTIGIREFNNVTISGDVDPSGAFLASVTGNIRLGQDPPAGFAPTAKIGQYCNNIKIDHVAITSNGSPMSAVQAYEGVQASVTNCTITGFAVPPLSAGTLSQITTANVTQQTYANQHAPEFWAISSRGTHVAQGGDKSVTVPAPAPK